MAILQAILTFLSRSMGKAINTVFGWATMMLFGKVPEDRQIYLSVVNLASVVWLLLVIGSIFPRLGAFLVAFVPLSEGHEELVRWIMIVGAVILPAVVGIAALFTQDKEDRPKSKAGYALAALKGYSYTIGLALTLVFMLCVAPFVKAREMMRRWKSAHVPVIVESENYLSVVRDTEKALQESGFHVSRSRASWTMRLPTKILTTFTRIVRINHDVGAAAMADVNPIDVPVEQLFIGSRIEALRIGSLYRDIEPIRIACGLRRLLETRPGRGPPSAHGDSRATPSVTVQEKTEHVVLIGAARGGRDLRCIASRRLQDDPGYY